MRKNKIKHDKLMRKNRRSYITTAATADRKRLGLHKKTKRVAIQTHSAPNPIDYGSLGIMGILSNSLLSRKRH